MSNMVGTGIVDRCISDIELSMCLFAINNAVTDSTELAYNNNIRKLIQKNNELIGDNSQLGYLHKGNVYIPRESLKTRTGILASKRSWPSLHVSIQKDGDDVAELVSKIKNETRRVLQILTLLTRGCNTVQRLRNAVPDGIWDLTDLYQVTRTKELKDSVKETAYKAYLQHEDSFDYITALRIIQG